MGGWELWEDPDFEASPGEWNAGLGALSPSSVGGTCCARHECNDFTDLTPVLLFICKWGRACCGHGLVTRHSGTRGHSRRAARAVLLPLAPCRWELAPARSVLAGLPCPSPPSLNFLHPAAWPQGEHAHFSWLGGGWGVGDTGHTLPCFINRRLAPGHKAELRPQAWEPGFGPAVPTASALPQLLPGWPRGSQPCHRRAVLALAWAGSWLTGRQPAYPKYQEACSADLLVDISDSAAFLVFPIACCQFPVLSRPLLMNVPASP